MNAKGYFVCDLCGAFTVTEHGFKKHCESMKCKVKQTQSGSSKIKNINQLPILDGINPIEKNLVEELRQNLAIAKSNVQILRRIPKSFRSILADKLCSVIKKCCQTNTFQDGDNS